MRLDKELQLAINIMARLNNNPISSKDLSTELNSSPEHVQKIACKLCKAELCASLRGFGGGFFKKRHVNALEIVKAMQLQREAQGRANDVQMQLQFVLENIWI
jgi:DNA-binding IscR family transcriptional regulator